MAGEESPEAGRENDQIDAEGSFAKSSGGRRLSSARAVFSGHHRRY